VIHPKKPTEGNPIKNWDSSWRNKLKAELLQESPDRALILVSFAADDSGRPLARLLHLEKVGDAWRVDDVTDPLAKSVRRIEAGIVARLRKC
jgi:hypothetical protein